MTRMLPFYDARDYSLRQFVASACRRAARAGRTTDIRSVHVLARHLDPFGELCHWCGDRPWEQLDHVVPLVAGGQDVLANIVPACAACNSSKADRDATEWVAAGGISEGAVRRRVAYELRELGWSGTAIADALGVALPTVSNYRKRPVPDSRAVCASAAAVVAELERSPNG